MATASIERRLKRLLAQRDAELAERARERKRIGGPRYQKRKLIWHEKQGTLWEIIRGPWRMPQYLLRQDPLDILRKGRS
jgi:hypothetical protein